MSDETKRYRKLAINARALADRTGKERERQALIEIAEKYELMADEADSAGSSTLMTSGY